MSFSFQKRSLSNFGLSGLIKQIRSSILKKSNHIILTKSIPVLDFIFESMHMEAQITGSDLSDLATQAWEAFLIQKMKKKLLSDLQCQPLVIKVGKASV